MLNLQFIPFPTIKTARLVLRELTLNDAPEMFIQRSHPEIGKYIHRQAMQKMEEALAHIEKISLQQQKLESVTWAMTTHQNNKLIGQICLWNIDHHLETGELGYSLHPDFFKQGLMNEAVTEVVNYGFKTMQLKRIDAFTNKDNRASLKLLSRNKFERNLILEENLEDKTELDYNQIHSIYK